MKQATIILTAALLAAASCSIKPPDVTITGEKTVLEKQLLGSYREGPEGIHSIAAVPVSRFVVNLPSDSADLGRTTVSVITPERMKLLRAESMRVFLSDDVKHLKAKGIIGENNSGYLSVLPDADWDASSLDSNTILRVVQEENQARRVVMDWYIGVRADLTEADIGEVEKSFAGRFREESEPGEFYQDESGNWIRKK